MNMEDMVGYARKWSNKSVEHMMIMKVIAPTSNQLEHENHGQYTNSIHQLDSYDIIKS